MGRHHPPWLFLGMSTSRRPIGAGNHDYVLGAFYRVAGNLDGVYKRPAYSSEVVFYDAFIRWTFLAGKVVDDCRIELPIHLITQIQGGLEIEIQPLLLLVRLVRSLDGNLAGD